MLQPQIVEVIRRVEQGRTEPYLCRADNGQEYFVKHRALPASERVAEWLAATVAKALGLPVAPFTLVRLPDELGTANVPWLRDLGAGIGFGSEKQPAREFTVSDIDRVDATLAARIAAFDWWVRNGDRSLSSQGGNANLLWRTAAASEKLVLIDHNLAFDRDFSVDLFFETHVFANQFKAMIEDFVERDRMRDAFCAARRSLAEFWSTIPHGWRFSDPECTIAAKWTEHAFDDVLARCEVADRFWDS